MTSRVNKNVDIFKNKLRFKEYAESTIETYSYFLRLFLEYHDKRLSHLTKTDAYYFIDECSHMEHSQKNQVISSLKLFYKFVLDQRLDKVKLERPRKKKRLPRVIDSEGLELKISRVKNLKHKAILSLGYRCGLRVSEVVNLKISDIDSKRMLILIRDSKGSKDRYVAMSETLLEILRDYYTEYSPDELLFEGQHGAYSVTSCQKVFKRHISNDLSFHSLRHSHATKLVEKGVNMRIIQKQLGHRSVSTSEIYTHVSNLCLQEAAV